MSHVLAANLVFSLYLIIISFHSGITMDFFTVKQQTIKHVKYKF